ncbi:MAG: hypothetical protein NUV45_15390 [Tepidanaerobacteraceae bacterium]|nr:hypothetical protein [Tepidanaerobacteraceae bacterium]
MIPKTQNPKALAILLKALIKLSWAKIVDCPETINYLIERIGQLKSEGVPYFCWGYSFPWQTRTLLVPAGSPNLVCTVFVADALLDAYEATKNKLCLEMAVSAGAYIFNELYWSEGDQAGFSYPQPGLRFHIYNADLLAAALLSRLSQTTGDNNYRYPALKVARYAAKHQNEDGSWFYGETPGSRWIDNFHTGYNLLALRDISKYAETEEFIPTIIKGLKYYKSNFFHPDGAPKYYHNKPYPIDTHCVAQSIITLETLNDLDKTNHELAVSALTWAIKNMWHKKGYFYYQVHRLYKNRISYMRWSQAWMLLAMANIFKYQHQSNY